MAYGFFNWVDKIRRYHPFSRKEWQWMGISTVVMAFMLGYNDGNETFELVPWVVNLLTGMIAIAIAVIVRESVKRVVGLEQGYRIEFKPFVYGLLGGLVLTVMSYGHIVFLAYSGMRMHMMDSHRLGYFRYGLGYFTQGKIALFSIFSNLVLALIFKSMFFLPEGIRNQFVLVNVLFAITNSLPIPPLDGGQLIYSSRIIYAFAVGAVISLGLLLLVPGIHWVIIVIGTLVSAVMFWLMMLYFLEGTFKKASGGH